MTRTEDRNGEWPAQTVERCETDGQIWPCYTIWSKR